MKSLKCQSLATALLIAVAAPLSATIVGFDDLDGSGNQAIPKGLCQLELDSDDICRDLDYLRNSAKLFLTFIGRFQKDSAPPNRLRR
jgi:hypothetical protein